MKISTQVFSATRADFEFARNNGATSRFVVNGCRRDGWYVNGWYVYESSQDFYRCTDPERVIDPIQPEV